MLGKNKIYPIYKEYLRQFVFSTGFMNIVTEYDYFVYGWMLSEEFLKIKQNTSTGTLMEGLNNSSLEFWKINKIDFLKYDENLNCILSIINVENEKILIFKR